MKNKKLLAMLLALTMLLGLLAGCGDAEPSSAADPVAPAESVETVPRRRQSRRMRRQYPRRRLPM